MPCQEPATAAIVMGAQRTWLCTCSRPVVFCKKGNMVSLSGALMHAQYHQREATHKDMSCLMDNCRHIRHAFQRCMRAPQDAPCNAHHTEGSDPRQASCDALRSSLCSCCCRLSSSK